MVGSASSRSASAGLIVGLQAPGPLRRVLSWRPLVLLGLVSYGAYLFHWPVFVAVVVARLVAVEFAVVRRRRGDHPGPGGRVVPSRRTPDPRAVVERRPRRRGGDRGERRDPGGGAGGTAVVGWISRGRRGAARIRPRSSPSSAVTELEPRRLHVDDPVRLSDADPVAGRAAGPAGSGSVDSSLPPPARRSPPTDDHPRPTTGPLAAARVRPAPAAAEPSGPDPGGRGLHRVLHRARSGALGRRASRAMRRSTCSGARGSVSSPPATSRRGTARRSSSARSRCSTRTCRPRSIVCSPTSSC